MSRKILFGAVASLALLAAFAMPSVSEAHGPRTRSVAVRHVRHVRNRTVNCAPRVRTYHRWYNGRYHTSRGHYHTHGVHHYHRR
ncbi:MAG TPA: hypothetical protein VFE62_11600 [Gemmataceae bacterium]|nr:hypothetical protein [Gemmataceae bacterium]